MNQQYKPPYTLTPAILHFVADGNGRMGRLWQTLILQKWKPLLAYLPVETVVRQRQDDYYRVLAEATPFVEFMLQALLNAIQQVIATDQVSDQVADQVARIIQALAKGQLGSSALMKAFDLTHKPSFRQNYLDPALEGGWIERTQPDSPRSPTQRYRLTEKGRRWMQRH